jgi:hypothetical protein
MRDKQVDKWFGISLNKKKAYYILVFGIISLGFFTLLIINALNLLIATPDLYIYDISIYYNVLLLGFSNLLLSFVFIGVSGYTLRRIRQFLFRKSPEPKNN